jgi:hypothetical protein
MGASMIGLDDLRLRAEHDVEHRRRTRRPTWAPALILDGELLELVRSLEQLGPDDKPVARLWAVFADPTRRGTILRDHLSHHPQPGTICRGFELRAGETKGAKSEMIFRSYLHQDGTWREGPNWTSPPWMSKGQWLIKPEVLERQNARYAKLCRARDLGHARVWDFLGHPDEEMVQGSHVTGRCWMCGKTLSDPISVERGIGPECISHLQVAA